MRADRSQRFSQLKAIISPPKRTRSSARISAPQQAQALAPQLAREQLPAYFYRLSPADQKRYLASDGIRSLPLKVNQATVGKAAALCAALAAEDLSAITCAAQQLLDALTAALGAQPVAVEVRGVRPHNRRGELHGIFYQRPRLPRIVLWARTARRHQPVAPKTFLRTLIHELLHHLDYSLLKLGASFHTYGFFQRESSLVRALSGFESSEMQVAIGPVKKPHDASKTKTTLAL
jgi:hypothetical protein